MYKKILVLFLAAVAVCAVLWGCGSNKDNNSLNNSPVSSVFTSKENNNDSQLRLYFSSQDGKSLKAVNRLIKAEDVKKDVGSIATIIVHELIKGPPANSGLKATIPKGTNILSDVTFGNGVATVNLNKAFVDNQPKGKDLERTTLFSIVNSITELKEVQKVQFKIDGKVRTSFKGNYKFNMAFPRDFDLIGMQIPFDEESAKGQDKSTTTVQQESEEILE